MNRYALAYHVVVTDHQAGRLAIVFPVGGRFADTRNLVNMIAGTNSGRPPDYHVWLNYTAGTELYIGTNKCPGANLDVLGQPRCGVDNSLVVNHVVQYLSISTKNGSGCRQLTVYIRADRELGDTPAL